MLTFISFKYYVLSYVFHFRIPIAYTKVMIGIIFILRVVGSWRCFVGKYGRLGLPFGGHVYSLIVLCRFVRVSMCKIHVQHPKMRGRLRIEG